MTLVRWTLNLQEGQGEAVIVPGGDLRVRVWIPRVEPGVSGGRTSPRGQTVVAGRLGRPGSGQGSVAMGIAALELELKSSKRFLSGE